MNYAFINGHETIKFDPLVFVYNDGKYEVICQSFKRQKFYYDHLQKNEYPSFEAFLKTFPYCNIDTGEVDEDVESMLNKLRSKFMLQQIAEEEISLGAEESKNPDRRYDAALMKISKRMRTGANER